MSRPDQTDLPNGARSAPVPLDFFTSSWNRFAVLDSLRAEPRSRAEIRADCDVSRPTLSRILAGLQDREWIVRIDDEYRTTPQGDVVAAEVEQLVANLETAERLHDVFEWLPPDRLGFDIAHLDDAQVITPDPTDTTGPMRRLIEQIEVTDELHVVASGVTVEVVETLCENAAAGELTMHCVIDELGLEGIRAHDHLARAFADLVSEGRCTTALHTGREELIDCNRLRDVVMFCGNTDAGRPGGVLVSEDETVRSWARLYFDRSREEAEPLSADAFTA